MAEIYIYIYMAYIVFLETDETGVIKRDENYNAIGKAIYTDGIASNELSGVSYDKATNTLTITNLSTVNHCFADDLHLCNTR